MSDTKDHADTLFSNYIVRPFLTLPKHLQPMRIGNVIPKSEMVFESPKKKITTNSKASMEADVLTRQYSHDQQQEMPMTPRDHESL